MNTFRVIYPGSLVVNPSTCSLSFPPSLRSFAMISARCFAFI